MMHKTDAAIQLIRNALTAGIKAGYVLMDTWFTTEPMLKNILDTGIHAIGMVKQLQQRYTYNGRQYTLPGLKKFVDFSSAGNIFGSLVVTTKTGIPVKIIFVRNRNKKSECLYLLSTDTSLNNAEIVRIYGNRWSIECFFKASKSFLKLGSEFQSRTLLLGYKTAERLYAFERIEGKQEAVDRLDDVLYHKIPYISDYI